MIETPEDAYRLLRELGAAGRLLQHLQLVGEAAEDLIDTFLKVGLQFDANLIRLGVAVHDAGKIIHAGELHGPGSLHEPAGESLLLSHGVQPAVARCCVTHARWQGSEVSFEERAVALADKLWKGKRDESLELAVIDDVAAKLRAPRWDVYARLDDAFEQIASHGPDRVERSRYGAEIERDRDRSLSRLVLNTPTAERLRRCNESAVAVLKAIRTLGVDAVEYGDLAGLHCPGLGRIPDRDMSLMVMVFDDEPLRSEFAARWVQQASIRDLVQRTSLVPADLLFVSAARFREAGWLYVEPHLRLSPEGVLYLASDSVAKYELRTWAGA